MIKLSDPPSTIDLARVSEYFDGREYGEECSKEEERYLKETGLVLVFGASDDLCEFRGAISDEAGCYDGGEVYLESTGIVRNCPNRKPYGTRLSITWNDGIWRYEINVPHAEFNVLEDENLYGKGIVFYADSLARPRYDGCQSSTIDEDGKRTIIGLSVERRNTWWVKLYPSLQGYKLDGMREIGVLKDLSLELDDAPIAIDTTGIGEPIADKLEAEGLTVIRVGLKHGTRGELVSLGTAVAGHQEMQDDS